MIRYALTCADGHSFESWFQSAAAFDRLLSGGMVECAVCSNTDVRKSIMAPRISTSAPTAQKKPEQTERPLSQPSSPAEQALRDLRQKITETAEDVGKNFAKEAREMHLGEKPERAIYGEAKPDEARALLEDGIPVVPLPFAPGRKTN
ncbi:DUF1178 family protein [Litoreibacter roseus]|uniref:DUF1178 family protein n=1 Tax=Litoreibacter roseus TaxID=2601869 RepID=A0A6N6JJ70_9RHOB|nr:DUF1178 family protein [Litoreibacter roseus]GFE65318.1 hypothetical protein KIN_23920 [Litoreibacter roseus]